MNRMITLNEVEKIVGFKKTKIYALIEDRRFPDSKQQGRGARWEYYSVETWRILYYQSNDQLPPINSADREEIEEMIQRIAGQRVAA